MTFTYEELDTAGIGSDAVIRPISPEELNAPEAGPWLHPQLDEALKALHARGLFKAKAEQTEAIPTLGLYPALHAVYIGLSGKAVTADDLRLLGAAAARAIKRLKAEKVRFLLPTSLYAGALGCTTGQAAQALTEGLLLGLNERSKRSGKEAGEGETGRTVTFVFQEKPADTISALWAEGVSRGEIFASGVLLARELTNLPGNELTPEKLAGHAESLAAEYGLESEVLDEWDAAEQGIGALLAVGQGSANPPRMVVLHYKGAADNDQVWGLIGKGITFDTGGISLKTAAGMEEMISDMGGAAAVLGAMKIIGQLKPEVNVVAVIPTAENMPSDRSMKPGDVITAMDGTTIEVVNTDAEGRLVLADGLTTAIRRGATRLVDVATLTGACVVALGDVTTGAVTNDEVLLQSVQAAGRRAGERIWPLPSYPEYRKLLDSDAADLKNSGGRQGGAITGGLFIGAFAQEKPWVHLDIAGTAFLKKSRGWEPKGATGVMARTLAELLTAGE
ncbi:peptidase M17 [Paenibacillus beijingensis]|uniref:Probable cytosol aminopeptidase n=1 Tax=Paenibacillus beijingensis TaxID=1126833 RepID=A0A0D5NQA1_9BACL|nr:peptidase M17 [Paenibacillus beijingensis]